MVMRKSLFILGSILLTAFTSVACLGCSGTAADSVSAVIIAGNVANEEVHNYSVIEETLEDVAMGGGWVDVVIADGNPTTVLGGVQQAGAQSTSATVRAGQAAAIASAFISQAEEAQASCDNTDIMGALDVAASSLAQAPGRHEVHLFSTLLSTAGVVNLAEHPDWISVPSGSSLSREEMYAQLFEALSSLIPDLSDIDVVYIYDAGNVAGEQVRPTASQLDDLEALWTSLLLDAGVGEVQFVKTSRTGNAVESTYDVDTVAFTEVSVDFSVPVDMPVTEEVVSLTDSEVSFVPDEATLIDQAAAQQAIASVVATLTANPSATVSIYGSCASSSREDHGVPLSTERANVVRDLLVASGIDASRIIAVEGVGDQGNAYVEHYPDLAADGVTQTADAQKNRRVVIVIHYA